MLHRGNPLFGANNDPSIERGQPRPVRSSSFPLTTGDLTRAADCRLISSLCRESFGAHGSDNKAPDCAPALWHQGAENGAAFRRAFAALIQDGAEAVYVGDQAETYSKRGLIVELAEKYRAPAIYPYRAFVEIGGLMAHETDLVDQYTHPADEVAEILRGTKPHDVPFYQATKYDLIVNLKTAKELGIEIPNSLLAQADEAIE